MINSPLSRQTRRTIGFIAAVGVALAACVWLAPVSSASASSEVPASNGTCDAGAR